eukprot:CAMPEP_0196653674 /NCGR_PEP_ID=MMETSP1086-20130531/3324_1 /TAXON_ID=77921 /ORGANISM="Cyanoptyche  gloeocystis , Strain SAG4.97" /LENGTH=58 /DNA_ID=CAMNT_0041984989 /DNA_START=1048 /DNA_END=1224 /DNA_ORIENTATION=+
MARAPGARWEETFKVRRGSFEHEDACSEEEDGKNTLPDGPDAEPAESEEGELQEGELG